MNQSVLPAQGAGFEPRSDLREASGGISEPVAALAADNGLPDNPNSDANVIPGPDATTPTDPSANVNPAPRVPTDEDDSGYSVRREGSSRGTSGEDKDQPDN